MLKIKSLFTEKIIFYFNIFGVGLYSSQVTSARCLDIIILSSKWEEKIQIMSSVNELFLNQGIMPAEEKPQPSVAVRRAEERSRQKTSENRLHLLHLTGFPQVFDKPPSAEDSGVVTPRSSLLDNLAKRSPRRVASVSASSPRHGKIQNFQTMRTTNQVFEEAMLQALSSFKNLSPKKAQDSTAKSPEKFDPEYEEMLEARKLPFDYVVKSAQGLVTTVYREDFCKNPPRESWRTQTLPREEPPAPPKYFSQTADGVGNTEALIDTAVAPAASGGQNPAPRNAGASAPRQSSKSPRRHVLMSSPRHRIAPPVIEGEYISVTRTYFTDRGERIKNVPQSSLNSMPW
jgi:hypothetical protein